MRWSLPSTVCTLQLLAAIACHAAESDEWHMEYAPKQRVLVCENLNRYSPGENVREYYPYASIPPELAQQRRIQSSFAVNGQVIRAVTTNEHSAYHRPIFMGRIPAFRPADHTNITVSVLYEVTLYTRRLKPGPAAASIPGLFSTEKMLALRESKWLDFNNPEFASWLQAKGLTRQPQESLITFGKRAREFVHDHMTYAFPSPTTDGKPLTRICQALTGSCGHYAMLFVGIMRANGIPARELVGNWVDTTRSSPNPHVKAEFYVQGIGWVPVDATQGVFGQEDGNFLTYHLNMEPLVVPNWSGGSWSACCFQGIYLPCEGGSWDKPKWNHWFLETPVQLSASEQLSAGRKTVSSSIPAVTPAPTARDSSQRLKELKSLYDQGLINKDVYEQKKKEILDSL